MGSPTVGATDLLDLRAMDTAEDVRVIVRFIDQSLRHDMHHYPQGCAQGKGSKNSTGRR
jgi:hypothetical protein